MSLFPSEFLNCRSFISCTTLRTLKVRERKESTEEDGEERQKDEWNKTEWKRAKWKEIEVLQSDGLEFVLWSQSS